MNNSPFNLSEPLVAQRTGLPLDDVKKARSLGERCVKGPRGAFLWSETGVLALEAELSQKNGALPEAQPVTLPEALRVERVRTPRVLHVTRLGETYDPASPLHVWLPRPHGRMFRPGMFIAAKKRPTAPTIFDYAGDPARPERGIIFPRKVGAW